MTALDADGSREVYDWIEAGYSRLAPSYDMDIGENLIGIRMREVFRRVLLERFQPGEHLFEIGCGTGIDAVWLAQKGFHVVATDISGGMLDQAARRADEAGVRDRVTCRKLAAHEIGALVDEFNEHAFDGGFCHAGALNMEPDLSAVPRGIRLLLRPGGRFVCSVINQTSLFEVLFYPLVLRPRKAFRRLGNVVPIPISRKAPFDRHVVPARFYTPWEVRTLFHEHFLLETMYGLQVLLPPSNLTDVYAAIKPLFRPFEFLEARLASRSPFNAWGHHTVLTFRRR